MQEAAEHRRRKAELAQAHQGPNPVEELPHTHSNESPAHGAAELPWWTGERVIGGGPWSKLPRWQPDLDSPLPSSPPTWGQTADRIDSRQAPRSRKAPGQQKHRSQVETQPWCLRRPQSAPSFLQGTKSAAQPSENSSQAASHASQVHRHTAGSSAEGQHLTAQHCSDHHPRLQPARRAQRAAQQQHRSLASPVAEHQAERVVYVQRPSAQQQPRLAGSVPNFSELHAKWDAHLAAAKAAMHRRLTKPKVSNPISACWSDVVSEPVSGRCSNWVHHVMSQLLKRPCQEIYINLPAGVMRHI